MSEIPKNNDEASDGGLRTTALFASLGAAKKAGWIVRTRNEGPSDWVHYSATIFRSDDPKFCEFLVSSNAMWERPDAKKAALEWINNHVANDQVELPPKGGSDFTNDAPGGCQHPIVLPLNSEPPIDSENEYRRRTL